MNSNKGNIDSWLSNEVTFIIRNEVIKVSSELEILGLEEK